MTYDLGLGGGMRVAGLGGAGGKRMLQMVATCIRELNPERNRWKRGPRSSSP